MTTHATMIENIEKLTFLHTSFKKGCLHLKYVVIKITHTNILE